FTGIEREEIEAHLDIDTAADFFAFERTDALLEELAIKIETDGGDVAALLCTQEIARAPNFQVAHGDFKTAAEARVLFDRADALPDVAEQACVAREKEIRVGLVFVTAHPAAELVEVTQPEAVRAIDDDGVGVWDVDAALDDRGGNEDIRFAV